jgi:alkanesulfonate monooxygenase SsuD/methylene tetrahydromethanopterin reductase-like flavin-dependent oxidoreductase (luciferase family)
MLDDAQLYDRPDRAPAIIGAAGGPEAARLAARKADGMITTVPQANLIEAFRSAGGKGPLYAEVPMCYAASEDKAREIAHRYHRWSLAGGPVMPELPDTNTFAAASSHITPDDVAEEVSLGPSPEPHLKADLRVHGGRFRPLNPDADRTRAGPVLRVLRARAAPCSLVIDLRPYRSPCGAA